MAAVDLGRPDDARARARRRARPRTAYASFSSSKPRVTPFAARWAAERGRRTAKWHQSPADSGQGSSCGQGASVNATRAEHGIAGGEDAAVAVRRARLEEDRRVAGPLPEAIARRPRRPRAAARSGRRRRARDRHGSPRRRRHHPRPRSPRAAARTGAAAASARPARVMAGSISTSVACSSPGQTAAAAHVATPGPAPASSTVRGRQSGRCSASRESTKTAAAYVAGARVRDVRGDVGVGPGRARRRCALASRYASESRARRGLDLAAPDARDELVRRRAQLVRQVGADGRYAAASSPDAGPGRALPRSGSPRTRSAPARSPATSASVASAGSSTATREEREQQTGRHEPLPVQRADVPQPEEDVRERDTGRRRRRAPPRARAPAGRRHAPSVFFMRDGDEDDSRHHRQVQVAVGVPRHRQLRLARRSRAAAARRRSRRRRSRATRARRRRRGRAPRRRRRPRRETFVAPSPSATIDSPRAMMTISPCRSAKWPGDSRQPRPPPMYGAAQVRDDQRERPDRDLGRPSSPAATKSRPTPTAEPIASRATAASRSRSPAARDGVEREVRNPHERVGAGEEERVVAERVRHGQRRDQHRRHRPEHDEPHGAFLRVDRVRQPGVRGPGPPEHAEDEQAASEAAPGRVVLINPVTCVIAKTKIRSKKSSSGVTRSSPEPPSTGLHRHASRIYRRGSDARRGSRDPSTASLGGARSAAFRRRSMRSRPAATRWRRRRRRGRSCCRARRARCRSSLAAVPVHLALSLGWAFVLCKGRVRGAVPGAAAGLAIAALDLGVVGRRLPRIRALPLAPQVADHVAYGAVVGLVLARR